MKNILTILFLAVCCNSCFFKKGTNEIVISDILIPYLNEAQIDSFFHDGKMYEGVIYLYAREENDSTFLLITPTQCVHKKADTLDSFVYDNKLFICDGNTSVFSLFIKRESSITKINKEILFCEDVGNVADYDPKFIDLLIKDKNNIQRIFLSEEKALELMLGEKVPPPPFDPENEMYRIHFH